MARNCAISSGESGGGGWLDDVHCLSLARSVRHSRSDRGAAQPVVDGFAEPVMRNRHHRDGARALGVERAKIAEKIGGGLIEIAARGQIHHRGRGVSSRHCVRAERQQRLAGLDAVGIEPHLRARRVMRGQHARRQRLAAVAVGILGRLRQRAAEHALDLARAARRRDAAASAASKQPTMVDSTPTSTGAAIDDQVDPPRKVALHMGGRGRRDMAGEIGRRRHHRAAERAQDLARHRMRGNPDRDGVEAGGGEIGDRAVLASSAAPASAAPARTPRRARSPRASKRAIRCAAARSPTWAISGLKAGRPLA